MSEPLQNTPEAYDQLIRAISPDNQALAELLIENRHLKDEIERLREIIIELARMLADKI